MEKEFVPYEQALYLKELGFNEPCLSRYCIVTEWEVPTGKILFQLSDCELNEKNLIKAPTFSQAFRRFREKYNLFCEIQIDRTTEPKFCFDIFQYEHFGNYEEIRIGEWYLYRTQEEAELECLKKLIEIVKEK